MKRTPLRNRRSAKSRFADAASHAWMECVPYVCMECGCRVGLHPHEMLRGSRRQACQHQPAGLLLFCNWCHDEWQNRPLADQLALKKLRDPEHYDLLAVLQLRWPNSWKKWVDDIEREVTAAIERMGTC